MKKKLPVMLLIFTMAFGLHAQNKYTFSKTSGNTYTDLSGDIVVTNSFNVTTGLYTIPNLTGQTFKFFDLPFTFGGLKEISIGEYPFLRVDNDSSLVIIDAAFAYADTIDATSKVSYVLQGAAGSRVLKLQYKNMKFTNGAVGNYFNVQIWYHQQSGVIEIHYGPRSANNASGFNTIQGPNVGIFYSPISFSGCYEKLWCNGLPGNLTLDSTANYVFKAMLGIPDDGTLYRFAPRVTQTVSTVGLKEEIENLEFTVAPNPAGNFIALAGRVNGNTIAMFDVSGRLIKQWPSYKSGGTLDVSKMERGVYFIEVSGVEGTAVRKKIVIER